MIEIQNSIGDCITGLAFLLPETLFFDLTYQIGSGFKNVFYERATDTISEMVQSHQVCGPVDYEVYLTDASGTTYADLPSFVSFNMTALSGVLTIFSGNPAHTGVHYLLVEVFLRNYALKLEYPRRQQLVKLTMLAPSQIVALSFNFTNATVFDATMQIPCEKTSLMDLQLPIYTMVVGENRTQDLKFSDTSSVAAKVPERCGKLAYSWLGPEPSFGKLINGELRLSGTDEDIGSHVISFRVALEDYPDIFIDKTVTVIFNPKGLTGWRSSLVS